jgi:hypothetical protein
MSTADNLPQKTAKTAKTARGALAPGNTADLALRSYECV